MANAIGNQFSSHSSHFHGSDTFRKHRDTQEKVTLCFYSNNTESYNDLFSLAELHLALNKANDSAPDPDQIHYQMIKHLPAVTLNLLLNIFNHVWTSGLFPERSHGYPHF